MREENIDCRKYRKSTHLASADLDAMTVEGKPLIFTIKDVWFETGVDVSGSKMDGYFCNFHEPIKDLMLNSVNRKMLAGFAKKAGHDHVACWNIGNWKGLKVEFYVDGSLKGSDSSSPYSYSWDTTNGGTHACVGSHSHTISVKAFDSAGNSKTATPVVVTMQNPSYCSNVTACTADAMQCPDGSYVSRVAPSCAFAACPVNNSTNNNNGGSCALTCSTGYSFVAPCGCVQVCPTYTYTTPDCDGGQVITGGVDANSCPLPPRCEGDNGSADVSKKITDFVITNWIPVALVLLALLLIMLKRG